MNGLMLHAGASRVTIDQVDAVPVPPASPTFQPVPHGDLVRLARSALAYGGLSVTSEEYGLTADGADLFSVFHVDSHAGEGASRSSFMVGLCNSHAHHFAVGICVGLRVFVCDNRAFRAERVLSRKHTSRILSDLPRLMNETMDKFVLPSLGNMASDIHRLETTPLLPAQYAQTMVTCLRKGLVLPTEFAKVDREWARPDGPGGHFPEHGPTAWRFLQAVTEVHKSSRSSALSLAGRTARISAVLEGVEA